MYDNLPFESKNQLFLHNLQRIFSALIVEHDITISLGELLSNIVDFFENKNGNFYLMIKNKATSISSIGETQIKEIEISPEDEMKMVSSHFAIEENDLAFFPSLIRINQGRIKVLIPFSYNNTLVGFITLGEQKKKASAIYDNLFLAMISNFASRVIYYSNNFINENHKSSDDMYLKMITDALSGVYIKTYIEQRMIEGMKEAKRYKKADSFCMVKIDNFSELRQKYGQQIVNIIIQNTGSAINNFIRKDVDHAGKYNEETFLILLPSTESKGALIFAQKLKPTFSRLSIEKYPDEKITVSIAVTTLEAKDRDKEDIFKKLNDAINNSVKLGGNKISINYDDSISEDLSSFEKSSGVSAELLKETIEHPVFLVDDDGNEIDFTNNAYKKWTNIPKRH